MFYRGKKKAALGDHEGVTGTQYDNGSVEVSRRISESHQSQLRVLWGWCQRPSEGCCRDLQSSYRRQGKGSKDLARIIEHR